MVAQKGKRAMDNVAGAAKKDQRVGLQQNLGHADLQTTLRYIGLLDAAKRQPPAMYTPPHWGELDEL